MRPRLEPEYLGRDVAFGSVFVQRPGDADVGLDLPLIQLLTVVLAQRLGVDLKIQRNLIVTDAVAGKRLDLCAA